MTIFIKNKYKFWIIGIVAITCSILESCKPSTIKQAKQEIQKSANKNQVQKVWNDYIGKIDSKNAREKLIKAVKEKLHKMNLSDKEISDWHEKFKIYSDEKPSLNIIVIPDLSNRIKKISYTSKYDKEIISEIYRLFFEKAKLDHKSQDKLVVEVTDDEQAYGIFGKIAENLTIDMSDKRNNENSRKYLASKEKNFKSDINDLYANALKKTTGADYVYYFNRIAPNRVKKSDINTEYINKIIILTDGYLETNTTDYTPIPAKLKKFAQSPDLAQIMAANHLAIPKNRTKLPNTEILVLELYERSIGKDWHKEILTQYWDDWFKSMGCKTANENYQLHQMNVNETKKIIKKFLD